MATFAKSTIARAIGTAFAWHGGGGSPFYRFASTRTVQDEEHKRLILAEYIQCRDEAQRSAGSAHQAREDVRALDRMARVVLGAEVGRELLTFDEYRKLTD